MKTEREHGSPCGWRRHRWSPWWISRAGDPDFFLRGYHRRRCERCGLHQTKTWWRR